MSLDVILDDIASYMKANMSELELCEQVGGKFGYDEVKRRSIKLPAAFVTLTGTREGKILNNKLSCRGYFTMVLVASSKAENGIKPQDRTRVIHQLLGRAMTIIAGAKNWGNEEVDGRPDVIAAANAYRVEADKNNIALYGITWEQDLLLLPADPLTLDDLLLISTDYQIEGSNPEVDAHDDITLDPP